MQLSAGHVASGYDGAAGTGHHGDKYPCGQSQDTAACASSCTRGRIIVGRTKQMLWLHTERRAKYSPVRAR